MTNIYIYGQRLLQSAVERHDKVETYIQEEPPYSGSFTIWECANIFNSFSSVFITIPALCFPVRPTSHRFRLCRTLHRIRDS